MYISKKYGKVENYTDIGHRACAYFSPNSLFIMMKNYITQLLNHNNIFSFRANL